MKCQIFNILEYFFIQFRQYLAFTCQSIILKSVFKLQEFSIYVTLGVCVCVCGFLFKIKIFYNLKPKLKLK